MMDDNFWTLHMVGILPSFRRLCKIFDVDYVYLLSLYNNCVINFLSLSLLIVDLILYDCPINNNVL